MTDSADPVIDPPSPFARLLGDLPCSACVVACDPYLTLVWANTAFFELMGCDEQDVRYRFAKSLVALWDDGAAEQLAALSQSVDPHAGRRFRHGVAASGDGRVLETDAALVEVDGVRALCCITRDRTGEARAIAESAQIKALGARLSLEAGLEVFSYDASTGRARVFSAGAVLGRYGASAVCENFPDRLLADGLVHPEDAEQFRSAFERAAGPGFCGAFDLRLGGPADNGRWRWYRVSLVGNAPRADGGAPGGGIFVDVTEHKDLAMEYLDETRFYHLLLTERDAYGHVDVTDNVILKTGGMWNLYNELLDAMTYQELVTTFIGRVVHPDDRPRYLDLMQRDNFVASFDNGIDHLGCEFRRIVEQNKMAWMELHVYLAKDPTTRHLMALLTIKNIDKRKRQELQLQSYFNDVGAAGAADGGAPAPDASLPGFAEGADRSASAPDAAPAAREGAALPTSLADDLGAFSSFLFEQGEMAYLVDPETYELICGNAAFYDRIGEIPERCAGRKCYEAVQGRTTPCPFCGRASWSTDKFFLWRNVNEALDQEFLVKNKLLPWKGREALLAIAVDISNNKSIVDSLDNGMIGGHYLLAGVQQVADAPDLESALACALETVGRFFHAARVCLWQGGAGAPTVRRMCWTREGAGLADAELDERALDAWLAAQSWTEPVLVENPESLMRESFALYRFMKKAGIANVRWARLRGSRDGEQAYLSVENMTMNLQNVAFLESFSVFVAGELSRRGMVEKLVRASSLDDLTGLLNRESYERRLEGFDADGERSVGVVMANVNDMKIVNATKGFQTGNYYLRQFAAMLGESFPPDCAYRLNGDEFAVIVTGIDRCDLEARMRELRLLVRDNGLFTISAGYSWDGGEKNIDELTDQAVSAMEADKRRFHDQDLRRTNDGDRRRALRDLVSALRDGRFDVFLQPKVNMSTGALTGAEALVRYVDPKLGVVSPARFIPVLEDRGLVRHVDLFVFERVCRMLSRWTFEGGPVPPVSLNFSRRTLLESDLMDNVEAIAARYDFERSLLEIEITESFAAIGKSVLYQAASDIHTAGFSLALDDFGTKYTDLSLLSGIDFNMIKLDRSLIDSLCEDRRKQTVVQHIVSLCDELQVNVMAEGVETVEQERVLRKLGCRHGQGYLYGRPVPLEEFEREFLPPA